MDGAAFRDGVFALHTRRFGVVPELMIKRLAGLGTAKTIYHDLHDDVTHQRVEVKFSRVLRTHKAPIGYDNLLASVAAQRPEARMVPYPERTVAAYDCNIQQVKRAEFDLLYYGLFFADRVSIFRVAPGDIGDRIGYSDKQHKGNTGEGQFHIKPGNIAYHEANFLYRSLSYDELVALLSA